MIGHLLLDIQEEMVTGVELPGIDEILEIGKGKIVCEGKQAAILNFGARLDECKKARENS